MIALFIVFWFLCGLAGSHIGLKLDKKQYLSLDPVDVWLAVTGPISLVIVVMFALDELFEVKE